MTENEINRTVAEDQGYTNIDLPFGWIPPDVIGDLPIMTKLPPYTTSLDAIRAAAMGRFTGAAAIEFGAWLKELTKNRGLMRPWQLTALDWCEAHLRAAGKWIEP